MSPWFTPVTVSVSNSCSLSKPVVYMLIQNNEDNNDNNNNNNNDCDNDSGNDNDSDSSSLFYSKCLLAVIII